MTAHLSTAPGLEPGAAAPTSEGARDMNQPAEIRKQGIDVNAGDIITRHPDRPDVTGEWTVTGRPRTDGWHTTITYSMTDGGEGVFVLKPGQQVTVRPAVTYRAHAHLTDHERCEAFREATSRERDYLIGEVIHRYGEIFDAVFLQLQRARAAGAEVLRDQPARRTA